MVRNSSAFALDRWLRGLAIATLNMTGGLAIRPEEASMVIGTAAAPRTPRGSAAPIAARTSAPDASAFVRQPKVYKVMVNAPAGTIKNLRASNAQVFAQVKAAKRAGTSKDAIASALKMNPKTVESCLYQLRQAGVVESHPVTA